MDTLYLIFISYFIGSIPFGYILYYIKFKEDIRKKGSGNPGATNVLREGGKFLGITTLILDLLKGFIPVFLAKFLFSGQDLIFIAWLAAAVGHIFSVFLLFNGGKGVATTLGGALGVDYRFFLVFILVYILIFLVTKLSSLSSLVASISFIFMHYFIFGSNNIIYTLALVCLIFIRHFSNIKRLIQGSEKKVI